MVSDKTAQRSHKLFTQRESLRAEIAVWQQRIAQINQELSDIMNNEEVEKKENNGK